MKETVTSADNQMDAEMIQNLRDADCSEQTIAAFLADIHAGRREHGMILLQMHRRQLLEDIHAQQKRIDCLDYLLYALKNGKDGAIYGIPDIQRKRKA